MTLSIRDAVRDDLPGILAIHNDAVLNTTAIWNDNPVDLADHQTWFETQMRQGFPILVAADTNGAPLGYASFRGWRPFEGFRATVEHSVYVRADQRGKGLGLRLLETLIERARNLRLHVMVAAIESGNAISIQLHQRLGFEISGQMSQVGQKFGRWLDLTFMQLTLDPLRKTP